MYNVAPEANHYFWSGQNGNIATLSRGHDDLLDWVKDNRIAVISESTDNNNSVSNGSNIKLDAWAYEWPFPLIISPTANRGNDYEVHWRNYNQLSVGASGANFDHTNDFVSIFTCTKNILGPYGTDN